LERLWESLNRVAVFLPERSPDRPLGQIVFH